MYHVEKLQWVFRTTPLHCIDNTGHVGSDMGNTRVHVECFTEEPQPVPLRSEFIFLFKIVLLKYDCVIPFRSRKKYCLSEKVNGT